MKNSNNTTTVKKDSDFLEVLENTKDLTLDQIQKHLENQNLGTKKSSNKSTRESKYNLDGFNKYFAKEIEKIDRKERNLIRKLRNKFLNDILFYQRESKTKELRETVKNFNEFYKSIYKDNSFTIESLCNTNADADTKSKVILSLEIIKLLKLNK